MQRRRPFTCACSRRTVSVRLGRVFDCVLLHDAVNYMTSRSNLAAAIATAFEHTAHGGVAMFQPDFVAESFTPGCESGGSDGNGRGLFDHSSCSVAAREVFLGLRA